MTTFSDPIGQHASADDPRIMLDNQIGGSNTIEENFVDPDGAAYATAHPLFTTSPEQTVYQGGTLGDLVVGIDVSQAMLDEAERNCVRYDVHNVVLMTADDELTQVRG